MVQILQMDSFHRFSSNKVVKFSQKREVIKHLWVVSLEAVSLKRVRMPIAQAHLRTNPFFPERVKN